ncbi:MAG TPA: LysE family transporter [Nitrospinota bacterium]|nr:LysE family transporter [Nitrospinota bacterium]
MDWSNITVSVMGMTLGLSAGFYPGPLTALVISETLARGLRGGVGVSIAPLVTDFPIIIGSIYIVSVMAKTDGLLALITLAGGFFLLYLAWNGLRQSNLEPKKYQSGSTSLARAVVANALNPNPYMFWITIGAPICIESFQQSHLALILFLSGFYLCLVGSKISMAILVSQSKALLRGAIYRLVMTVLAFLLTVYAGIFIYKGLVGLHIL